MARSLDPIGAQLPLSHNPLIRIGYQPPRTELKIEDLIKQWQQGWQQFGFTALKELTGLDFSSPQALVLSLGDLIGDATQDVLKTLAKVFGWGGVGIPSGEELARWVGQQVFGLIDPSRLPQIPLGAIVKSSPNLLSNGAFSDATAILDSEGKWVVDNTVFRTAAGSARTSADGTIRELLSADLIPVKAGQKLDVSGFVKYSGLTASAGAVQLGLTAYGPDKETVVSRPQIAALGALSNASANWSPGAMSGTYTTPQTGVSYVRVRLTITESATAGTIWFDDLVAHVGGNLLSIDWIDGLAQQLLDFANGLGAAVRDIANRLTMATWQAFLDAVKGGPGGLVDHIVDKLQHLGFDGKFDAAQLINIAGSAIQTFMDTVAGVFGATNSDVQNRFRFLSPSTGKFDATKLDGQILKSSVQGLEQLGEDVVAGFKSLFDGWFGSGGTGSPSEVQYTIEAIKDAVINGYTVATFTSSQLNWGKPNCTEMVAVLIGGGQNGQAGIDAGADIGASGGLGGSYTVQQLDVASLPAALDIEVGTAGNRSRVRIANGANTGAIIAESGPHGAAGGQATAFGYSGTASAPGNGGYGAAGGSWIGGRNPTAGGPGTPTPAALGGTAGAAGPLNGNTPGGDGGAGGNVSVAALTKCGGGGGGGGGAGAGGAPFTRAGNGGKGGPGGYPGGGGGGGGGRGINSTYGSGDQGPGGPGATGVVWIFYR